MRRLLFIPLLLLVPTSALASPATQVRQAVKKYELAWASGSGQAICALLPQSKQKSTSLIWADTMQQAELDCPATLEQKMQVVPQLRPESDPTLRAQLQKLRLTSISKGKAIITGQQATFKVKYRAPGCRSNDAWQLQRIGRRWVVTDMAQIGDDSCYSAPASPDQTASLRGLAGQQVAAAFAGNASAYCALTEPWSWRQFGSVLGLLGVEARGNCLTELPLAWSKEDMGPPLADEQSRQQATVDQATWKVRGSHAWSTVATHQVFAGCWSKEPYEAWRVGEQWLVSAPGPGATRC